MVQPNLSVNVRDSQTLLRVKYHGRKWEEMSLISANRARMALEMTLVQFLNTLTLERGEKMEKMQNHRVMNFGQS